MKQYKQNRNKNSINEIYEHTETPIPRNTTNNNRFNSVSDKNLINRTSFKLRLSQSHTNRKRKQAFSQ